ncbi:hypothetical protein EPA93_25555 [Ktedonosporobacter rubrisoli]|uniref:DUF948 domain-containing protein n=1 Tax=Ktedonosporobacter rubrisoli TaxID=2509675 RepID=A0A4V0YZB7_KTERU|nr:hypothetical protein [Ktedonosporobacter rubrisoli]QBD79161.1 hypothetical protein EPA93_25555 [Ktedonosporobacter rubrisoli]
MLIVGIIAAGISGLFLDVLYVFLMLLAAFMIVATLLQVYSIILLIRTIISVRNEMKPLLASVQETLNIVKDTAKTAGHTVSTLGTTTQMAGDLAVAPTVKAAAAVVASRQVLRVFLGKGQARNRAEQRRQEQLEAIQEAAKANGTGGES